AYDATSSRVYEPRAAGSSTLSLHDALPISEAWMQASEPLVEVLARPRDEAGVDRRVELCDALADRSRRHDHDDHHELRLEQQHRSEEHTSELQSRVDLVCRLLLEKKKLRPS